MLRLEKIMLQNKVKERMGKAKKFSYSYIAKLLGISFQGIKYKFKTGRFTIQEAFAIFNTLITDENLKTLEFFEYLFTEEDE